MLGTRLDEQLPAAGGADRRPRRTVVGDDRIAWRGVALAMAISVLARLRMAWAPISADEGGFVAIARAWGHGNVLYRDVWVDRPQGLLLIYRCWDWLTGDSTAAIRVLAMLFGILMVVSVASIMTTLAGRTAGVLAAILVAVTSSNPSIEGHLANGELLSGAIAAAGLAVGCRAMQSDDRTWLFVASGMLGEAAMSVKQSGFEGLGALAVWLVVAALVGWRSFRASAVALGGLIAGAASVLGACALHGALTSGFSNWWYAFAGYRLEGRSAVKGANWDRYHYTANIARPTTVPLLCVIAVGGVVAIVAVVRSVATNRLQSHSVPTPAIVVTVAWLLFAAFAFITGGQFFRHYWVTLCPSLAALSGLILSLPPRRRLAFVVAAVVMVPAVVSTVRVITTTDARIAIVSSDEPRGARNIAVVSWFDAHRAPGDGLYVLCASASIYASAHVDPPYPYLWSDNVLYARGAQGDLLALFASDRAPRFVARFQRYPACDLSGRLKTIMAARYRVAGDADGVVMLERIDRLAEAGRHT